MLFDEFKMQEDELSDQYKRALAKTIRRPTEVWDVAGATRGAWDMQSGRREMENLDAQRSQMRKDMVEQQKASMVEALRGAPDDIANLVRNPATRAEGLKMMASHRQQEADRAAMTGLREKFTESPGITGSGTIAGGSQGGAGGFNEYGFNRAMSEDINPRLQEIGKQAMTNTKPFDPSHAATRDARGNVSNLPGAVGAVEDMARAKRVGEDPIIDFKTPDGNTIKVPRSWAESQYQQYAPNSGNATGGGALPSSLGFTPGAPASGGPTAVSAPPTGGAALPGATTAAFGQPQEMTTRREILMAEVRENYQNLEQARAVGDQQGVRTATQNLRELDRELQLVMKQSGPDGGRVPSGMLAGSGQPPVANADRGGVFPNATAAAYPPVNVQPTGTGGPSKYAETRAEGSARTDQELRQKWAEARQTLEPTKQYLENAARANAGPTNSGFMGPVGEAANYIASGFGKGGSQTIDNTRMLESSLAGLKLSMVKLAGSNPSNIDLQTVAESLPKMSDSPQTRAKVIEQAMRGIRYHEASIEPIERMVSQGYSLLQAQQAFDQQYRAQEAAKQGRPTEAPGQPQAAPGQQSALPSTMTAAQMKVAYGADKPEGGGGPMAFAGDLANRTMSLPKSLLGPRGGEAIYDSWIRNPLIAAGQLTGLVDRENWPAEEKRQQQRKDQDPYYEQARQFYDIANPVAAIGTKGAGMIKNAGAGLVQGLTEPNATLTGQLRSGAMGAGFGGGGAVASHGLPSTAPNAALGPDAEALLKKFPEVRPTSSQLNPEYWGSKVMRGLGVEDARALEQQKALTASIMKDAGIKGDRLTPEVLAKAKTDIGGGYGTLFRPGDKFALTAQDKTALTNAVKALPEIEPIMGQSRTLATLFQALDKGTKISSIDAKDVHQAWKDLGRATESYQKQEGAAIREILEGIIARNVPTDKQGTFKELNRRWGAVEDMERVFSSSGGEGFGAARGTLAPGKLSMEAGRGPHTGTTTDEANRLANMLRMRNYEPDTVRGQDITATAMDAVRGAAGPILSAADRSAVNRSPAVKKMIELMRTGALRVPNQLYTGEQDAP